MAIGKGNGRHWIKAAVKRVSSQLDEMSAAKQAKAAHERAKTERVAALLQKSASGGKKKVAPTTPVGTNKTEYRPERRARFEKFLKDKGGG